MTIQIEICLNGIDSALAAQQGGATRAELCDNLIEGGTTPSQGMIEFVAESLSIDTMVMVRPRGGDFLYTDHEFEVMRRDTKRMHQHKVMGVVFGMLNSDGTVDQKRTAELIDLARPLQVTFHRAFDMTRDPLEALDTLMELGVERILTSGQALTAMQGLETIAKLQKRAANDLIIMPAVGVSANNARHIIDTANVREIHIGSDVETNVVSGMSFQNPHVAMGDDTELPEYTMPYTTSTLVNAVVKTVNFE